MEHVRFRLPMKTSSSRQWYSIRLVPVLFALCPDTRLFEVWEAFKRSLLLGFQAHIRAYFAIFSSPAALRATVAEPLINALNHTPVVIYLVTVSFFLHFPPSIRVEVLVRRTVM